MALAYQHRNRHEITSRCTSELDFTHFYHAMRLPHAESRLQSAVREAESKLASGEWEDLPRRSHTTLIRRLEAMHTAA